MHWILQENLFKESEWENLVGALERFNIPYSVHKVIPFIGELMPPAEPKQEKVVCFGSYSMRHAAKEHGWNPGVYDLEPINFEIQREHWGDLMLNYDSKVVMFKDVHWEGDEPRFIRPIEDSKVFAGGVFEWDEFRQWQRNVCVLELDYGNSLMPETLVQVCTPKTIYSEYRYWIVDKKVVTKSLYKRGNTVTYSPVVDARFDRFVDEVLRFEEGCRGITLSMVPTGWMPHRAWVLDVCETPDGIKIVEINTINAAGFYAGNVQDLVVALEFMERTK
jgi:hypothetical protein